MVISTFNHFINILFIHSYLLIMYIFYLQNYVNC